MSLHLLVQNTKRDVLEVGDRRDLIVEEHLLGDDVYQVAFLLLLLDVLVADLVGYSLSEGEILIIVKSFKVAILVLGQHAVHLAGLEGLDRVNEHDGLEDLLLDLLDVFVLHDVWCLLEIHIF